MIRPVTLKDARSICAGIHGKHNPLQGGLFAAPSYPTGKKEGG